MFLVANELGLRHLNIGEAGLYALLGYAVVFLGLVLLMTVVTIIVLIMLLRLRVLYSRLMNKLNER